MCLSQKHSKNSQKMPWQKSLKLMVLIWMKLRLLSTSKNGQLLTQYVFLTLVPCCCWFISWSLNVVGLNSGPLLLWVQTPVPCCCGFKLRSLAVEDSNPGPLLLWIQTQVPWCFEFRSRYFWNILASLWNVSGSTHVLVLAWNSSQRGIWGLPPSVKAGKSPPVNVLVQLKTQLNKNIDLNQILENNDI